MSSARYHVVVENHFSALREGTHGQLFVAWHAQLADDEDVERHGQGLGDLEGDRHSPSWQLIDAVDQRAVQVEEEGGYVSRLFHPYPPSAPRGLCSLLPRGASPVAGFCSEAGDAAVVV